MKQSTKKLLTQGAAGAVTAAAIGYYFYGSKSARKHRLATAKWALDLKKEVVNQAKKIKKIDRETFFSVVDGVMDSYQKVRSLDPGAISEAALELKDNWEKIQKEFRVPKKLKIRSKVKTHVRLVSKKRKNRSL